MKDDIYYPFKEIEKPLTFDIFNYDNNEKIGKRDFKLYSNGSEFILVPICDSRLKDYLSNRNPDDLGFMPYCRFESEHHSRTLKIIGSWFENKCTTNDEDLPEYTFISVNSLDWVNESKPYDSIKYFCSNSTRTAVPISIVDRTLDLSNKYELSCEAKYSINYKGLQINYAEKGHHNSDILAQEAFLLITFLSGRNINWFESYLYNDDEKIGYYYRKTPTLNNLSNMSLVVPKRSVDFESCFSTAFGRHGMDYYREKGIYPAIISYSRVGAVISEEFLFTQFSLFESLVNSHLEEDDKVFLRFKNNTGKNNNKSFNKKIKVFVEGLKDCDELAVDSDINGYASGLSAPFLNKRNLKDLIEKVFSKLGCQAYNDTYLKILKDSAEARNKLFHGNYLVDWEEKYKINFFHMSLIVREACQILIAMHLGIVGDFNSYRHKGLIYHFKKENNESFFSVTLPS